MANDDGLLAAMGFKRNPRTGRYEIRDRGGKLEAFVDEELVEAHGEERVAAEIRRRFWGRP